MISNQNFFHNTKILPVDKFFENVLFDKKIGYYSSKSPFGNKGDFKIYSVKGGKMCWAAKTPCSYSKTMKYKKFLGLNMVYRDDW